MPGAQGRHGSTTARPATWSGRHSTTPPPGRSRGNATRTCRSIRTSSSSMRRRTGEEGRIKAGEFAYIKRDGEYYTAVFYSKLAGRLEAMGLVIDRRGGKEWEIAGIPQSMIDKFNKRSHEIEAEHRRRMKDDPDYRAEYKHELAAKTRSRKQKELTPEELREAWDAQLTDDERDALAAVYRREVPRGQAGHGGGSRGLCGPSLLRARIGGQRAGTGRGWPCCMGWAA